MITLFEKFEKKPDLNVVSPEFWKMARTVNWKKVAKDYTENPNGYNDFFRKAQERVYKKYDFTQIRQFEKECHDLYQQLSEYFRSTWLDDRYSKFMPSDDGYWDLLSLIIGFGKGFLIKCINDKKEFVKVAKEYNYVENFSYLFIVDEKEYIKIRSRVDPFFRDIKKYNI